MAFVRDDSSYTRGAGAIAARDAVATPRQRARKARRAALSRRHDARKVALTRPASRGLGAISTQDPTGAGMPWGQQTGAASGHGFSTGPRAQPPRITLPGSITRPVVQIPTRSTSPTTFPPIGRPPSRGVVFAPATSAVAAVIKQSGAVLPPLPISTSSGPAVVVSTTGGGTTRPITGGGGGGGGGGYSTGGGTITFPGDGADTDITVPDQSSSEGLFSKRNLLIAGGILAAYLLLKKKG